MFGPTSVSCARCQDSITYKASGADLTTSLQSSTCIAIGNAARPEAHALHKLFQHGSKRRCVMCGSVLVRAGDAWKETTMLNNRCLQRVPGRPTDQADARRLLQQVRAWMNPSQSLKAMFLSSPEWLASVGSRHSTGPVPNSNFFELMISANVCFDLLSSCRLLVSAFPQTKRKLKGQTLANQLCFVAVCLMLVTVM